MSQPPASAAFQPPLRWWSQVWRYAVCLLVGLVVWLPVMEEQVEGPNPALFWIDLVLGIVSLVLVAFRRRWPLTIALVLVALTPLTSLGAGAALLATVSVATHRVWWQLVLVAVVNLLGTFGYYALQPNVEGDPFWVIVLFTVAFVAASIGWGMYIGSRRELLWTLRQRAETAEAERDLRAAQARSTERARIAREMHDVLAHRISQISMHAGALSFREDLSAEEVRASAAVIQAKAHEALTDLREVLGVLRDADAALVAPQPTYADLPGLVDDARAAGAAITFDDAVVDGQRLPDSVGRTVYRIVQEGITNAAKHAPAATLRIELTGSPEAGITVALRNALGFGPTRTPGAGLGLVGLAERTALRGGQLEHHVERDPGGAGPGTFVLAAWLPWSADPEQPEQEVVA